MSDGFELIRSRSSAAAFHARPVPDPAATEVWWHDPIGPALVLGSTQGDDVVDHAACAAAGVDVVRRRSGGGAVLLVPGEVTWVDVIVPRDGPGWGSDIHTPMRWLGHRLVETLADLVPGATLDVHDGAPLRTDWSSLVCFDGIGTGEVVMDGAKLVGISQRRTRHAARLQCCWYSAYDPAQLTALLATDHRPPAGALAPVAVLPTDVATTLAAVLASRLA